MNETTEPVPCNPDRESRTLVGELAAVYDEFRFAARDMEQTAKAHQQAQARFREALGRFTQLAATAPDA